MFFETSILRFIVKGVVTADFSVLSGYFGALASVMGASSSRPAVLLSTMKPFRSIITLKQITTASYFKGYTERLRSSRQPSEYEIDVNNTGRPFAGRACKKKIEPNSWDSEMAKIMELKIIKHDGALKELN